MLSNQSGRVNEIFECEHTLSKTTRSYAYIFCTELPCLPPHCKPVRLLLSNASINKCFTLPFQPSQHQHKD